jgi:hypothetical protein
MPFAVVLEKFCDPADGFGQVVGIGQKHDTEVIGCRPIEAGALHDQHLLLREQVVGKLPVVGDRVDLGIEPRKHVERRFGLDDTDTGDLAQQLVREIALAAQPTGGRDQVIDALVATQRRLDRQLPGRVGAQAQRGQHVEALDVVDTTIQPER